MYVYPSGVFGSECNVIFPMFSVAEVSEQAVFLYFSRHTLHLDCLFTGLK